MSGQTSDLARARQLVADVYAHHGTLVSEGVVVPEARARAGAALREAVEFYGWQRLFGEVERPRDKVTKLRRGDRTVSSEGEQQSLPLLAMTVPQARLNNAGKRAHAAGAVAEAVFERRIIDLAERRMIERGLDPQTTHMVIGEFIEPSEIAKLRAEVRKAS
jgi:hypothetical protein